MDCLTARDSYLVGNPEDRYIRVKLHIRWHAGWKVDPTCMDCLCELSYLVGNPEDRFSRVEVHIR